MIDWASKLTSRKFLESLGAFVSLLIIAFHGTQELAAQVVAIIMAGGTVIAYIISEGRVDAARLKSASDEVWIADEPPSEGEEENG